MLEFRGFLPLQNKDLISSKRFGLDNYRDVALLWVSLTRTDSSDDFPRDKTSIKKPFCELWLFWLTGVVFAHKISLSTCHLSLPPISPSQVCL